MDSDDQRKPTPALMRLRDYTEDALKVDAAGPPWHRGILAIGSVLVAIAIGHSVDAQEAIAVAPAAAVFMTIGDTEGPIKLRIETLLLATFGIMVGGLCGLWFADLPFVFCSVFLVLVALAGLGSFIGPPYQSAGRYALIVGLFMSLVHGVDSRQFLGMVAATSAVVGVGRVIEHLLAPDVHTGDFKSVKEAVFAIRAGRWHLLRFVAAYVLAAGCGWAIGRMFDSVHPSWVTATVVVVMWPDAHRSYQRVFQRIVGTLAGAAIALPLTILVHDVRVLGTIAAAMVFFLPQFIRRNYWLHSGLMLILIMVSLELWSGSEFSSHLIVERIGDVLLGSVLALAGTVLAFAAVHARIADSQAAVGANAAK